jgi:molecular chaperone Hsp33
MSDRIVRAISADGTVQAAAICSRDLVERARNIHNTTPTATAALGRALSGASLMGSALKGRGASLTLQFKGNGPLGTVLAVSDAAGNVRGYVAHPGAELPLRSDGKLDVGGAVGHEGTLTVIKDLNMKEPYVGTVDLLGGEIAEDIAGYFVESEQIPTACALGVLIDRDRSVRSAGGYLIQLMPGAAEDTIARVEGGIMAAGAVSALLEKDPDPEHLLRAVLSDFEVKILESDPVEYRCYCSRERVERALISLGTDELEAILREQGGCRMTCQFCDAVYDFSAEELRALIDSLRAGGRN